MLRSLPDGLSPATPPWSNLLVAGTPPRAGDVAGKSALVVGAGPIGALPSPS
jgi:threonine dehydrogenase-like Zn-dependent dehydrogenase